MADISKIALDPGESYDIKDTIARNQIAALTPADYIYVQADNTGLSDATAAIQAAIDLARSIGKDVVIPAGTYRIDSTLLYYSNMRIIGVGRPVLLWNGTSAATDSALLTTGVRGFGGYGGAHDVEVDGIVFDGGGKTCTVFSTAHAQNVIVRNCEFRNISNWHFVEFNSSRYCFLQNCWMHNHSLKADIGEMVQFDAAASIGNAGPQATPYDGTLADYCYVQDCIFSNTENFVGTDGAGVAGVGSHSNTTGFNHCFVINCSFLDMFAGIRARRCVAFNIFGNTFQYVKVAIVLNHLSAFASGEVCRYVNICNNTISGTNQAGAYAINFYSTSGSFGNTASDHCLLAANSIANVTNGINVLNNSTYINSNLIYASTGISIAGGGYHGTNYINGSLATA